MADQKISQLTVATLPLAGTEVLPVVQSGATKKVASDDLTVKNIRSNATTGILQMAGVTTGQTRVATVPDANFTVARIDASQSFTGDQTLSTGNLVIGTAGKGINFSADPSAAGMTSELLDDYEEGTWTPTTAGDATGGFATAYGEYTKIGRLVYVRGLVVTSLSFTTNKIGGLPFTPIGNASYSGGLGVFNVGNSGSQPDLAAQFFSGTTNISMYFTNGQNVYNPSAGYIFWITGTYNT